MKSLLYARDVETIENEENCQKSSQGNGVVSRDGSRPAEPTSDGDVIYDIFV